MLRTVERMAHELRVQRLIQLGRRRGGRVPRQQPPAMLEHEYARAILELVAPRVRAAFTPLMTELPHLLASAAAELRVDGARTDAGEGKRVREITAAARERLRVSLNVDEADRLAQKFAARTSTYQRVQLGRQTRAALGVDLVGADRTVPALLEGFVANNVAKITGIGDKLAAQTERIITNGVASGKLHGDLAKELAAVGYGERESAAIARDQVGKLYGQLNAARQQELGCRSFIWRTVKDGRVRDEHAALEGEEFEYASGGAPGEGLPGEAINCRCYPEPVFAELLDLAGA